MRGTRCAILTSDMPPRMEGYSAREERALDAKLAQEATQERIPPKTAFAPEEAKQTIAANRHSAGDMLMNARKLYGNKPIAGDVAAKNRLQEEVIELSAEDLEDVEEMQDEYLPGERSGVFKIARNEQGVPTNVERVTSRYESSDLLEDDEELPELSLDEQYAEAHNEYNEATQALANLNKEQSKVLDERSPATMERLAEIREEQEGWEAALKHAQKRMLEVSKAMQAKDNDRLASEEAAEIQAFTSKDNAYLPHLRSSSGPEVQLRSKAEIDNERFMQKEALNEQIQVAQDRIGELVMKNQGYQADILAKQREIQALKQRGARSGVFGRFMSVFSGQEAQSASKQLQLQEEALQRFQREQAQTIPAIQKESAILGQLRRQRESLDV